MPQSKSCKKRVKTSAKANVRNRAMRSKIQTATKRLEDATTAEDVNSALQTVYSVLDRAAKKNVIHKNKAANRKSKLSALAKTLVA